jgi:hypothetical protein
VEVVMRARLRTTLLALVVALIASTVMALRASDRVQGDERGFLYYGTMQAEMYWACVSGVEEACSDWRWAEAYDSYGSRNPKLGLYALGLVDHATRGLEREQRVPAMRLIWGLLASLCVAGTAWLASGGRVRGGGLVAASLLLVHPVFRASQVALLPDLPMLLFVIGALICCSQALVSRRLKQGLWLLDAGVFVGLAVATKLYALARLPALALWLLVSRGRLGWRGWLGLGLGLGLGGLVFVGSNPYLLSEPGVAMAAMTSGHVQALGGALGGGGSGWASLRYLGWLPFSLFVPILDCRSEIQGLIPLWGAWLGWVLCGLGTIMHIKRGRWLPLLFALSTFGLTAWVITRFDPGWLYPRAFLLPSVAAVWLASGVLDALAGPRWRRHPGS